ncbi:MAG: NAD(P)H-binding protein, partial [Verrucomicrobiota bacterium]
GTRNVVFAAQDANVKQFVHMSALGARSGARSRYHQSKWEAEEQVRRSGLGWTIFRPSIIYGPGDGFVNLFAKIIRFSPVVPVMGSGRTKFQPVSAKAVGAAFVKALSEPRAIGETCDLCGPQVFTFDELVDQILAVMQRRRLKLHVPPGIARCQAVILEFVFARLLQEAPPLNRDQLIMLQEDNVGNPQPANELFGLKPVSFREGISAYLRV